jgi:hypothetical protein
MQRAESGAYLGLQAADSAIEMSVRRMGSFAPEYFTLVGADRTEVDSLIARHESLQRAFRTDPTSAYEAYATFLYDLSVRAARHNVELVETLVQVEAQVDEDRLLEDGYRTLSRLLAALALIFAILPGVLAEALPRKSESPQ